MLYLLQLLLRRTFLRQANTGAACPARRPGPGATGRLLSDNAVTLLTGTAGPVGAQGNAEMLLWSRPVFVGLFVCLLVAATGRSVLPLFKVLLHLSCSSPVSFSVVSFPFGF